jgi:hypothetical protein
MRNYYVAVYLNRRMRLDMGGFPEYLVEDKNDVQARLFSSMEELESNISKANAFLERTKVTYSLGLDLNPIEVDLFFDPQLTQNQIDKGMIKALFQEIESSL